MSATPPPTPVSELEDHLGYWLRFVSNHVSHAFRRKVEAAGVTVSEWVALRALYRAEIDTPGALAQAIGMSKGAVSKLLDRLEAKGLAARTVNPADRRQHAVALTPAGHALVPRLAELADRNDAEFFGHLPGPVRAELAATMQDIVRHRQLKTIPLD
ncbi:MarR family winged helix-turn-helix transcriptional regulator [Chitinimonas koreensis]|uniref:MarR family winged helix-turn-helix transcriptional regulator n=1 Tax=Chitinimonas koreensis TaxID=356302 RepID=UPI000421250E|nr:MarR family transcriptional regulator [Chitinimonas koreensis]QNM95435.1 MarR family transcriptional regulator [Chitinimonas koreensis]